MNKQIKGSLALLCGTIIWGSAFIAQSVGMELIGPFTFQAVRCLLAVVFLALLTLVFDFRLGIPASLRKWKSKRLWFAGGICGCALFIAASLQQVGLLYTDPGKAGFLTAASLAGAAPGKLLQELLGLNKKFKLGLPNPTMDQVSAWVAAAQA